MHHDVDALVNGLWTRAALLFAARHGGYLVVLPGGAVVWARDIRQLPGE